MSLRVIQGGGFRQRKKATKIQRLKNKMTVLNMANKELINRLKLLLKVMKEFEKENNWAIKPNPPEDGYIVWLGEGEPPLIAKAVLARIRGAAKDFDEKVEVVKEDASGGPEPCVELEGGPDNKSSYVDPPDGGPAAPDKVPFVVYGPDSMPAGGMVVAPEKPKD